MKADVTTLDAKKAGSVDLDEAIFGLEPRQDLLHRMVAYQLAARRAGTRRIKTRGEIMGSTRKIVRQKGSGGARHGNRKASLFRGGAKAFGPVVRDHAIAMPKKVRALALKHALSSKAKGDALIVLDEAKVEAAKTGPLRKQLGGLGIGSALIIDGQVDDNFAVAARNIPNVDVLPVQGINVYDILRRDTLVLTKAALEGLEARFK